ncbi:MAG: 6-bladed beta-propeller [Gammaproteobacteria bacterium]|nr:6-bladed beta-propeller [Gammaproteobacteria bacterium]
MTLYRRCFHRRLPRFVFERTLIYSEDVEKETSMAAFQRFATGASLKVQGLVKPYGVAVRKGKVYVTDSAQSALMLFDIPGGRFKEIGTEEPGELTKPLGIDISPTGEVFVCDVAAQQVFVYDEEGVYQRAIGDRSIFKRPTGIAISPDGSRAYVVDTGGVDNEDHRVYIFSAASGELLSSFGTRGIKNGEFNLPLQAATAPDGTVYVVDGGNFRVQAFTPDGKFSHSFGSIGRLPGQFSRPKGIAADRDGNVYVVDTAFGNFQIFDKHGQLLMFAGERAQVGSPAKYMLPAGIDVDEDGRIYVVDQFFRKVDIFRPVHLSKHEGYAALHEE